MVHCFRNMGLKWGGKQMKVIQTMENVHALEKAERLPTFYLEEIKNQFLMWYEEENDGEDIEDFYLPSYACIYHLNHENDLRMLQNCLNDIEYVDTERINGIKYFRIGIMKEHQVSIIYFLEGTLPFKTEKWLEN